MAKTILVVATRQGIGLTSTVLGLYHALDRKGVKVGFHKPIMQYDVEGQEADHSRTVLMQSSRAVIDDSLVIRPDAVQHALDNDNLDELMETVIQNYEAAKGDADVVVIEGLLETANVPYAAELNRQIARALGADVILLADARVSKISRLENHLDFTASQFGGYDKGNILGAIVNYADSEGALRRADIETSKIFTEKFKLLGIISSKPELSAPRVCDLQHHLNATVLFEGESNTRRILDYVLFARTPANAAEFLKPGHCIFLPADRDDALMATTIYAKAGNNLACIVLTGPLPSSDIVMKLCKPLLEEARLPVLHLETSSWEIGKLVEKFNRYIPIDDESRIRETKEYFADSIKDDWFSNYLSAARAISLSPAAFRYQIVQRAIAAKKTIVLPEGDEPRTVVAASICAERGMARCVLLANPDNVRAVAAQQGVTLNDNIVIIDPEAVRDNYVARLVELRKAKGMTETQARDALEDGVMLGTMMLESGEVDGLVSGAVHTTANTIRPPLQIIKTAQGASMVSSVFFMCLPDQVLVYGDCAIVPNPSADELAQIAIQSNDSAKAFGIEPRVAMISYSTGTSGSGADVEKVKAATDKVRELRPDIIVDGPLQYDAAAVESVGKQKAPDSPVAGKASVFIFPDLNTGNTTYKAVQRSANAISMGPVLQGMRKPVNDLSRGALVDDIVYTIAITAVQAAHA
ncbi:MAG: phosphate acetyltransferase [Cardiobacteriaceae bacterium]|nr:phosphate acetyltransferase [Cardiobacteriaceae bacterium]